MTTEAIKLWEQLGNIPINDNEEIIEPFLHFDIGTSRQNIWHWFEKTFDLNVAENLMFINKGTQ